MPLSYLVKNSMDGVSVICKLTMKWYLMRMRASWLCPFKGASTHEKGILNKLTIFVNFIIRNPRRPSSDGAA